MISGLGLAQTYALRGAQRTYAVKTGTVTDN